MAAGRSIDLKALVRTIPGFPKPGIDFRDISTLLADGAGFATAIEALVVYLQRNFFLVSERGPIELIPTDRDVGSSQVRIDFVGRTRVPLTRLSVRTQLLRDGWQRR